MTFLTKDWNMGKCLEWCSQLPLKNRPQTSPAFWIQNVQCYFYFCRINDPIYANFEASDYYLYLKTNPEYAQLRSFSFTIYVNYGKNSSIKYLKYEKIFTSCSYPIFDFCESILINKPVNLSVGFPIEYLFVFEHNVGLLLSPEIKAEMKSKIVQTGSYLNANASLESLPDDFTKLLETGLQHDTEVKCGKHSLKVHRAVLSARSEVFKTMLQNNFLEGRTGVVQIQDMDPHYFRDFMQYLYTGSLPELTFDKAKMLYEAGDKYDIKSLMLRCSEYLQDSLSEENVFECFLLGEAHSDQKLKDKIETFILEKKMYLDDDNWTPFCEKFPKFTTNLYRQVFKRKKVQ